jgi:hypothetical protein
MRYSVKGSKFAAYCGEASMHIDCQMGDKCEDNIRAIIGGYIVDVCWNAAWDHSNQLPFNYNSDSWMDDIYEQPKIKRKKL